MKATRAATRYGASLLQFAVSEGKLEEVKADADLVLDAIKNSRDLRNLLMSPVIKPSKKSALIHQIFNGKVTAISERFMALIIKHGRENVLQNIFDSFTEGYYQHKNIITAKVTSATALGTEACKSIQTRLEKATGKTVKLVEEVKPELIGGFVIEADNLKLDTSIASGIKKLKRELVK